MTERNSAGWQIMLDDRVLEHLREEGWSSPRVMESCFDFNATEGRIRERCELLAHAEFLRFVTDDMVELTERGERYLDGEFDANHIPIQPSRVWGTG